MSDGSRRRSRVRLRGIDLADEAEFLQKVRASRALHRPWSYPPATPQAFREHVLDRSTPGERLVVCRNDDGAIVGSFGLSQIVHGTFRNAYLGYYALEPMPGRDTCAKAWSSFSATRSTT